MKLKIKNIENNIRQNGFKMTLCLFIFIQLLLLFYVNLTQMKYHIGYDASTFYLRSIELWKQHKLFQPQFFCHQTTFLLDAPAPLSALLMYIFPDVFLASGIANLIIVFFTIKLSWNIAKELKISCEGRLILLNIFLSPHLSIHFDNANDLGYFSNVLTSFAGYSVKLLCVLVFVYVFFLIRNHFSGKIIVFAVFSCVFLFFEGISVGYYLIITHSRPKCLSERKSRLKPLKV